MYRDKRTGRLVYSPSDLIRFMESPFASWMDRYHLERPGQLTPDDDTAEQKLVRETGDRHERKYLETLRIAGRDVAEIAKDGIDPEGETLEAMAAGREIIYQACLSLDPFRGYTDFLVRTAERSKGRVVYEVWDTKLARKTKPYYLVQLCCYAEMLEQVQGVRPRTLRVVLGNNEIPSYATEDFFYYYRQLKAAFLTLMAEFNPECPPVPDARADHGRWQSHAEQKLIAMDHLCQVARITSGQIKSLNAAGVRTVAELANARADELSCLNRPIAERLIEQARLQVDTIKLRSSGPAGALVPPLYRILVPGPERPREGLAMLPPSSPNDLFFDMEGFPLTDYGGLEYLFGVTHRDGERLEFKDWWAHDPDEEKKAFEEFIDWAHARWRLDPSLHIYHYAPYEVNAVRRLMGRHGTRENQVDELLRNGVFIDLYRIVQQGLRIGEPSYSIKYVEHLYREARGGDVKAAGESMVYYANWIESEQPREWRQAPLLEKIRDYNRDDCDSTCQLYDWLREEQRKAGIAYQPAAPKPAVEVNSERDERDLARANLAAGLAARVANEPDATVRRLHEVMLHLLEFHRRESKPVWWRMFDRAEQEVSELKDDIACIGGAHRMPGKPTVEKRSLIFTYRFDPDQGTKIAVGDRVRALPNLAATLEVVGLDADNGEIRVKIGNKTLDERFGGSLPVDTSFIPDEFVSPAVLEASIERLATAWLQQGEMPGAFRRLLLREPPRLGGLEEQLRRDGESIVDAAVRCVSSMQESALCIQGPPGTGKTYTAAKSILALLGSGKKVGITSNSRKAIENLLRECHKQAGGPIDSLYVPNGDSEDLLRACPGLEVCDSGKAHDSYSGGLVAGTAWLFSRPEWHGELDHLFIDEAGQVALANVAAICPASENLVIIGDQMQLEQPVQGSHPGDSGRSALEYYLNGQATVSAELGLFLPETRRLHPEICRFVSDLVYDGRLAPALGNENRRIAVPAGSPLPSAGIAFVPIEHDGNTQMCDEEIARIGEITNGLLGKAKFGPDGRPSGTIEIENFLFVAPYNAQVRRLRDALPAGARVGSVDKFQGQEAEVVILSMCSSFGEYGSRGLEFILDRNRMNVALSRARTLAIIVGDPRIATAPGHSVDAMRRINLYCRLVKEHGATPVSSAKTTTLAAEKG